MQEIITEKIKEISFKKVTADQELIKSGILSSILVVDLATALEEEFNVQIPFNEITVENFSTALLIEDFIKSKQ